MTDFAECEELEGFEGAGGRLRRSRAALVARTFTAQDRRKVVRVTVSGDGGLQAVELSAGWQRSLQVQLLGREVASAYAAARRLAAEEARTLAVEAGSAEEMSRVQEQVRRLAARLPDVSDALARFESERDHGEGARGRVAVDLDHSKDLLALNVRTSGSTGCGGDADLMTSSEYDVGALRQAARAFDELSGALSRVTGRPGDDPYHIPEISWATSRTPRSVDGRMRMCGTGCTR